MAPEIYTRHIIYTTMGSLLFSFLFSLSNWQTPYNNMVPTIAKKHAIPVTMKGVLSTGP
jgi:hypothetical protein